MPADAFGRQVMSLREVIAQLQELGERLPQLMDQPLWVGGGAPVYCPVICVLRGQHGAVILEATR